MKANYKVINNKQVQLRKVIEEFKPDDVASVILFRYNVMQALTSLNDDCSDFEETDMKETAADLTEFFEDAVNEAIDSFIDEDKRPNINFKKMWQEFPLIHVGDELPLYCMLLIIYCKYDII